MTQSKYTKPDNTTQAPSAYKSNIDNALEMHERGSGKHFQAHQETTPAMTVRIEAGVIYDHSNSTLLSVAAQSTGTIAAPTTTSRIDLVSVHQATGVLTVTAGTESASPIAPSLPTANFPICYVTLANTTTTITNSLITDARVPFSIGGGSSGLSDVVDDTTPQLGGNLDINGKKFNDTNGNELVEFGATADAVNHVKISNAATGDGSTLEAVGGDTNIDLNVKAKGSGSVALGNAGLKFPNSDGTANQLVGTNGSGQLAFYTPSVGLVVDAYVNFVAGSSPSITKSSNVSSVAKTASDRYQITFTTPLSSTDYLVLVTAQRSGDSYCMYYDKTTTSVFIKIATNDPDAMSVLIFGA